MKEIKYVITDREGIHARPAGLLVKEANKYASSITLSKGSQSGDAKRIFAVMGLAATPPTLPRGPMRRTTSAIPFSVADVVLANWFMRSSMLRVSGMLRCMAVR